MEDTKCVKDATMFRKAEPLEQNILKKSSSHITGSTLADGSHWTGKLTGMQNVVINGSFEGEMDLSASVVIGESGKVHVEEIKAESVVIAGVVKGNIAAQSVRITATGRIWGDITTEIFTSEEGAFIQGALTMPSEEEKIEEDDDD